MRSSRSVPEVDARDALLRGERPLATRSVLASSLLGVRPPRLPVRQLVRVGALFGIAEGAVRTALSRMVAAGEAEANNGFYALTGHLLERQLRIDDSQLAYRRPWDGGWELAVVAADRRPPADRAELRTAAMTLHFGEIREGVWGRPDNLDPARLPRQQAVLSAQCLRFRRALAPDDRGLAGRLFDLDGWAARAAVLRAAVACGPTFTDMAAPEDLVAGFVVSTAVLRHLQADPLLPDELLPADWPGEPLRREFAHRDEAFMRRLRAWMAAAG